MRLFADTNWLVASYFIAPDDDRSAIVERFARRHDRPLLVAPIVYLEARNVFSWIARSAKSKEWERFRTDLGTKLLLRSADWALVSAKAEALFEQYSHRAKLGTFDVMLVASALLAGATHFLSFDTNSNARALAAVSKLKVFPELGADDMARLAGLR